MRSKLTLVTLEFRGINHFGAARRTELAVIFLDVLVRLSCRTGSSTYGADKFAGQTEANVVLWLEPDENFQQVASKT